MDYELFVPDYYGANNSLLLGMQGCADCCSAYKYPALKRRATPENHKISF